MTKEAISSLPLSNIPEDGFRFFHGLSIWVEQSKKLKPHFINWKKGIRHLTKLTCIKPKRGEKNEVPQSFPCDTLYVPSSSFALSVFCQLRHSFCHNDLKYDEETKQYRIDLTDKVKIAGQFSLDAIKEFVEVFLSTVNKNHKVKSKRKSK